MDFIFEPPSPEDVELERLRKEKESVLVQYNSVLSEEEELLKKLQELRDARDIEKARIAELERQEKLLGPAEITANYDPGTRSSVVLLSLDPRRDDILQVIKKHNPSTNIAYLGMQSVPVLTWPDFEDDINQLKKIKWRNIQHLSEAYWKIKKHQKQLVVQWNPRINWEGNDRMLRNDENNENISLLRIPGTVKNMALKGFTVPLTEGWRLFDIHPDLKSRLCEWESLELLQEVEKEFNKRLRMKAIHTAKDSDVDVTFPHWPEFKSRGHQRVAWEFSQLTGGKSLITYSTGTGKTAIGIGKALITDSPRNIVVCPGALRINWIHHIEKHTGIKPVLLAGRLPTKDDIFAIFSTQPKWIVINYDILRTESKLPREEGNPSMGVETHYLWAELLNKYRPTQIIADEVHYIGNPDSNQSKALRVLRGTEETELMALSATPIKNRPGELWAVLNWLYPDLFPFHATFVNQYGAGRSILPEDAKKLRSMLETIMIVRDRKDINENLPPINRIVSDYQMSTRGQQVYNRVLMGLWEAMKEYDYANKGGQRKSVNNILEKLNRLIQVCAADKIPNTVDKALELADAMEDDEHNGILIFTRFKGTCCTITEKLQKAGYKALSFVERTRTGFKTLDMEERMEMVKQFQTDPSVRFMVVTSGTAREGLDITKAGAVIFNDLFWNPAQHQQCEGRPFYRESDMHGGDSHYLQFEDSIEDWITDINGIKKNTIEQIVEGKGADFSAISQLLERVKELFIKRGLAA